jgi:hypothetical protein
VHGLAKPPAVTGMLRRHWPAVMLLAAGTVLRAMTVYAFQPALLFFGDSIGYLRGARHLQPGVIRPLGYPLMLRPLLVFHDLVAVAVVQHVMGLAMAVMIYALLWRLGVGRWLAAAAIIPVLLDGLQLSLEQFVMSETLFEFLLVVAVTLLIWWTRPPVAVVAAAGGVLALAALTRSVGIAAIAPVLLFAVLRRMGGVRIAVLAGAIALPLVAYGAWFHSVHGPFALTGYTGHFLYGSVAPFARCADMSVPPIEAGLCPRPPPARRPGLGFYMWNPASPSAALARREAHAGTSRVPVDPILEDFSVRVIEAHPGDYARAFLGNLWHLAAPGRTTGRRDEPISAWQFRRALDHTPGGRTRRVLAAEGVHRTVHRGVGRLLAAYQDHVYTPGPLLAFGLVLGFVAAALGAGSTDGRSLRSEALLLSLLGLGMPLAAVAIDFDYRYLLPALVFVPPAAALGVTAIARHVRARGGAAP